MTLIDGLIIILCLLGICILNVVIQQANGTWWH